MESTRIFKATDKDGKEVVLRFTRPNQTLISKGDFIYREYFSKAIRSGIMTNAEANKLLKERGLWGAEQESELMDLRIKLGELEEQISGADRQTGISIYSEIKDLRARIAEINSIRSSIADNTAESVAAEMRTQFFASECVVYNDSGKRVFKDLTDFLCRLDEPLAIESYRQALISNFEHLLGVKVPVDADNTLPEDRWLEKISETSKKEDEVQVDAKESTSPKKRRGRKKEAAE